MSAMSKILLTLLLTSSLAFADSIGYISAESPEYGDRYPGEDVEIFFDEIIELSYEICNDAGVTIASKLRLTQGKVDFRDTKYTYKKKDFILRPSEVNQGAIEHFYATYNTKGREFLQNVAKKNNLDALFYAKFQKSSIRKLLHNISRSPEKDGKIGFTAQLYLPQSNAIAFKRVIIKVSDLSTSPTYDLDLMQASITKEYLGMFERALKTVQISGGIQRAPSEQLEEAGTESASAGGTQMQTKEVVKQAAKEQPLYDENW